MSEREHELLYAFALMARQHLTEHVQDTDLDSLAMTAGECALAALAEHGMVRLKGGHRVRADWTDAGKALLSSR